MCTRFLIGLIAMAGVTALGLVVSRMDFTAMSPAEHRQIDDRLSPTISIEEVDGAIDSVEPVYFRKAGGKDQESWLRLRAESDSPERRERMLATVEELVTRDPEMARRFALGEPDPEKRARLLDAMMRGWALHDFDAAARWARKQSGRAKERMMAALFLGASERPDVIIGFARTLSREEPGRAKEVGAYLINALGKAGNHRSAAAFATEGVGDVYNDWLVSAYTRWGYESPEAAVLNAISLTDPQKRLHAFRAAATGWAQTDPQALLESAKTFPEGPEKTFSMTVALREWAEQDAAAVARWVSNNQR